MRCTTEKADHLKCWIADQFRNVLLISYWIVEHLIRCTRQQVTSWREGHGALLTNMWYYSTLTLYFHPMRTFTSYIFIFWDMPHHTFYYWNKVCAVLPKKTCWTCAVTNLDMKIWKCKSWCRWVLWMRVHESEITKRAAGVAAALLLCDKYTGVCPHKYTCLPSQIHYSVPSQIHCSVLSQIHLSTLTNTLLQ